MKRQSLFCTVNSEKGINKIRKNSLMKRTAEYYNDILSGAEKRNPFLYITCYHCKGKGKKEGKLCPVCDGKKLLNPKKNIKKQLDN